MKRQNIFLLVGLIVTIIIIMGLYDFLNLNKSNNSRFVTEQAFKSNFFPSRVSPLALCVGWTRRK